MDVRSTHSTTSNFGVIKYARGSNDIIHPTNGTWHPIQYPALFDRQHPPQGMQVVEAHHPNNSVVWPNNRTQQQTNPNSHTIINRKPSAVNYSANNRDLYSSSS